MRFKRRFDLVVRRHTSARSLPEDFAEQARGFLHEVQDFITMHHINRSRIVNFDQVPRYFETENNSTVTKKGSREVFLRKASSSHKRFTFTPVINGAGEFLALHLLFANIKKCPKVSDDCIVDVNKTGMWNDIITARVIDLIVRKVQTPFREPTLILLDAYGTHVKFVQEKGKLYEQKNVYLKIIPPKMTGLLQPLDVTVNRSFQQNYNDLYNDHLTAAINSKDESARTKSGNVKMPGYQQVSEWIASWAKAQTAETIAKAFDVCGLVSQEDFSLERLHKPLRDCFDEDFSLANWEENHHEIAENTDDNGTEEITGNVKIFSQKFSFFKALHVLLKSHEDFALWLKDTTDRVKAHIGADDVLQSLFTQEEIKQFDGGMPTGSGVEFHGAASVLELKLKVTEVDKDLRKISENNYNENGTKVVEVFMFEEHFGIYEDDE